MASSFRDFLVPDPEGLVLDEVLLEVEAEALVEELGSSGMKVDFAFGVERVVDWFIFDVEAFIRLGPSARPTLGSGEGRLVFLCRLRSAAVSKRSRR